MSSAKCLFSWFLSLGSSTFKAIACTVSTIVLAAVMIVWVLCIWKSNKNEKTMREFIVKSYCWSLPSLTVRIARLTLPFITETIRRFCSSSVKWLSACLSVPKSDTKPPLNLGERKLHRNLSQENCNCARQKKKHFAASITHFITVHKLCNSVWWCTLFQREFKFFKI